MRRALVIEASVIDVARGLADEVLFISLPDGGDWHARARALASNGAQLLVTTDPEAWRLAELLGLELVRIELPAPRDEAVLRVCVVGAPASGKTTLARALAERLETTWVPAQPAAAVQRAVEDALARRAHEVLVCDEASVAPDLYLVIDDDEAARDLAIASGVPWVVVRGDVDERIAVALEAIS